tara:strand:- start:114 stop:347 length:234 start_codon:yes stop_codon:yes gene_type:complete
MNPIELSTNVEHLLVRLGCRMIDEYDDDFLLMKAYKQNMARVAAGLIFVRKKIQNLLSIEKKFPQNNCVTQYRTVNF